MARDAEVDERIAQMLLRIGERMTRCGQALTAMEEANSQCARVLLPLVLQLAQHELDTHTPMADDTPVLTFTGSGSSDVVTAGAIRRALAALDDAEAALDALANLSEGGH